MSKFNQNASAPSNEWSLKELGQYAQHQDKKIVETVWRLGQALIIAKAKCKHGEWAKWQAEYIPELSVSTIGNYRRVAEMPFDEVTGKKLSVVYQILGIAKPKKLSTTAVTSDQPTTGPAKAGDDTSDVEVVNVQTGTVTDLDTGLDEAIAERIAELNAAHPEVTPAFEGVLKAIAEVNRSNVLTVDEAYRILFKAMNDKVDMD
jgi:hypothetical protein